MVKRPTKHKFNFDNHYIDLKGAGEGDSTSLMKRMKMLEDQFITAHPFNDNNSKSQPPKNVNKILPTLKC